MTDEEKQAIKMMKFYQDEYRKEIKTLKENGEPEGYGTMIDVYKGHIINIQFVLNLIEKQQKALEQKDKEIQELKKYDIRNIKIDKDKIISSPSFTRKEVDLMNLGIALSLNADKLFNDESEEDDI